MSTLEIGDLVRKNETDYISGTTTISKYVDFSLSENVNKIDAYINSKHISGLTDSMGRDKPFFNIVTSAVNIWNRATDIDRRNIKIKPTKESDVFASYLATIHLQMWMRKSRFGLFLNDWGRTLARYGSAVTKFIEADGELHAMVIPWNRLIVDQVDFDNDVVIEVLELTPSQLLKRKGYDQKKVDELLDSIDSRETMEKQRKDNKTSFIKVYEVHGEMPLSYLTEKEEDEDTYVQQMHVISFQSKGNDDYDDFCLYKGKEARHPYMITHLIKEDGRTQSIGAVEHLFESQWMVNHTAKQIKDQLDLASKLIFQTSDGNFIGQNAIDAIETGDILVHAVNQPITQIQNNSHDIASLQNYGQSWKVLGNETTGTSESMMGNTAPSGTAWRQIEALLQESHSLFELMVENKALALEDMLTTYIIPFVKKQMDSTEEIVATIEDYGVDKIEARYVRNKAIKNIKEIVKDAIINGKKLPPLSMEEEMARIQSAMAEGGTLRHIKPSEIESKTWKETLKDLEWESEIDISGEQSNNQADMATLATIFQTVIGLGGQPMPPEAKMLFNKILIKTGTVSPLEIAEVQSKPQPQPLETNPSGGQVGSNMGQLAVTPK